MAVGLTVAAAWHVATHELLAATAGGLAVSMADDVFVDALYFGLVIGRRIRPSTLPLSGTEPGWMAIIIPAWDEADVIAAMLTALLGTLDYPRFRVFVGVYPNDPMTRAEVESVGDTRIEMVTCARPGPTTKADCLNHLWRAVVAYEADGIM